MLKSIWEKVNVRAGRLLTRIKGRAFRDALTEMLVTVATATLPIWFFPLMALFLVSASYAGGLFDHSVSNGELFLFCTSLVGPLLFILFRIYEAPDSVGSHRLKYKISLVFPHARKFAVVIFIICVTSATIFGLQKINPKFQGGDFSKAGYITLSIVLFVLSFGATLIAMMLRNEMDNYSPSKTMRKEEDDFATQYKAEGPQP